MNIHAKQKRNQVRRDFSNGVALEKILCPHTGQAEKLHSLLQDVSADPDTKNGVYAKQLRADLGTYNQVFTVFEVESGNIQALRRILTSNAGSKREG